ncbi:MAG: DHH family phosphoesterase [Clostridia bacterium]|nr:DHH family phosphoesterase [Clostridia bacterium]
MNGKYIVTSLASRISYIILAAFSILFRIYYPGTLSYVMILVSVLYIVGFEIYAQLTQRNVKKTLKNTIAVMNLNSVKRLGKFPLAVVVCDEKGDTLWYSDKFVDLAGEEYVSSLHNVKTLDRSLPESDRTGIVLGDKTLSVYVDKDETDGRRMNILYFFDRTDYAVLKREQQLLKPVAAYLMIDNYDELFRNIREGESSVAVATIDDAVMQWAAKTDGIIKKTEKNRYFFIFENRFLQQFCSDRFDILDIVRDLPIISSIPPTLSIGIGIDRGTLSESEDAARKALDMALSRGGDQAVISKPSGFEFFGGYARVSDTRTKIRSRVLAASFADIIKDVDKVIVMGHKFADMDSLGACIGVACIANAKHKNAYIVLDTNTNLAETLYDRVTMSERHKKLFITKEQAMMTVDLNTLLVVVDTHRGNYTEMPELLKYAGKIAVIDHHRKAADFIQDTSFFFHEPYASSTCEMVTEIMEYLGDCNPSPVEAEALLAGIYLDTKNFAVRTGTCTFEAAAFLKAMDANTINVKLMFQTDMETYRDRAEIVKNTQIYRSIFAISVFDAPSSGNIKIATSQAADEMLNIEGVQAAFTIFETKDFSNISSRSFGNINVQLIMEKLGGGGHQSMAGTQIKEVSAKEAYIKLTNAIDAYLEEQGRIDIK